MPEQSLLARLVVIRRHDQRAVRAHLFWPFSCSTRVARRVRTGAREDLAAPADETYRNSITRSVFAATQRRRLPGRSDGNHSGDADRDLAFDQFLERCKIDFAASKRRYQRGKCALETLVSFTLEAVLPAANSFLRFDSRPIVRPRYRSRYHKSIVPSNTNSAGPVNVTLR